jgi:hypothetical protein
MTIAITAFQNNDMESIDVTGAYLHADAPTDGKETILLGKKESKILVQQYPTFSEYLKSDGTMYMLVDKAMYGMIDSARYWYENISTTLKDGGYLQNPSACSISLMTRVT